MESFLRKIKLTKEIIKKFGLSEDKSRVKIPYFDEEKNRLFSKIISKDGSTCHYPDNKPKILYNVWNIGKFKDYVVICSDEIDCLTLLQLRIAAVACPEEGTFKTKWSDLFEKIPNIFTFFQNSSKTESYRKKIRNSFGFKIVYDVKIPDIEGITSINNLYVEEEYTAEDFKSAIKEAKEKFLSTSIEDEGGSHTEMTSGFVENGIIGELVFPTHAKKAHFIIFNSKRKKTSNKDIFEMDGKTYLPIPIKKDIKSRAVNIPESINNYKNIKNLISEIKSFVDSYIDIHDDTDKEIIATYILLTWVYDRFSSIPYMRISGYLGSGKSKLLKVLSICYKSINASNITPAVIFRIMDRFGGTLLIDEAELEDNSEKNHEIKQILRSGKDDDKPVWRADGANYEPRPYKVFGPKIFGSRRSYGDDVLESRIIDITMSEARKDNMPPLLIEKEVFQKECSRLRAMLLKWRLENYYKINIHAYKKYISGDISMRLNEMNAPLICIREGDKDFIDKLIQKSKKRNQQLIEEKRMSDEAVVIEGVYLLQKIKRTGLVFLKDISIWLKEERWIQKSSKEVSRIVGDLGLKTKHTRNSTAVVYDKKKVGQLIGEYHLEKIKGKDPLEEFKRKLKK